MAPADQFSAPGAAHYDSDTLVVGDGTWEFTKNTFLLPNLQGTNFETTRYNGMGNRFSTLPQYHTLIAAHGSLMAVVFLFLLPTSVMIARFYSREPGYASRYHAQVNIFAAVLLVAAFILPFFAVGHARSLTNPHHGIGVAIFAMFLVQIFLGSFVRYITKMRSLRAMLHQWLGRATVLLGVVQIPLGLTLYGSPKILFILYALWMGFLLLVYFALSWHSEGRRERYMSGARSDIRSELRSEARSDLRSEGGRTRLTESEYFSEHNEEHHSKLKWLGPLAAAAGLLALLKGRKKHNRDDDDDDDNEHDGRSHAMSGARSYSQSRRTTMLSSRPGSGYYDEKFSDLPNRTGGGSKWAKVLGLLGLARFLRRDNQRDDAYSAVSTETPYRQRSERATTISEFNSEYTDDASTVPPSQYPAGTTMSAAMASSRIQRDPNRTSDTLPRAGFHAESEYSSYVSPSRRAPPRESTGSNAIAGGILAGLGLGWLSRKMGDRRAKKGQQQQQQQRQNMRDDDDYYRTPTEYSRQTREGDSPRRGTARRPSIRRYDSIGTETALSEITASSFHPRPQDNPPRERPRTPTKSATMPVPELIISPDSGRSGSEMEPSHLGSRSEMTDATTRPRESSRRYRQSERAAAAAAARASSLARATNDRERERDRDRDRDRFGSPKSRSDDNAREHPLTLRPMTEEERAAARERDSILESPNTGRRYRRNSGGQRRAEDAAERRAEDADSETTALSPPNPTFAKGGGGGRRARDSGQTLTVQPAVSMVSSVRSHGTWSGMSIAPSQPSQPKASETAAADNRRRRRQERRRGSGGRPSDGD